MQIQKVKMKLADFSKNSTGKNASVVDDFISLRPREECLLLKGTYVEAQVIYRRIHSYCYNRKLNYTPTFRAKGNTYRIWKMPKKLKTNSGDKGIGHSVSTES